MRPVLGITNTSPAAPRTRWLGLVARGGVLLRRRIYPTLLGLWVALGGGAGLPHGLRCTHHRYGVSIETHQRGMASAYLSKRRTDCGGSSVGLLLLGLLRRGPVEAHRRRPEDKLKLPRFVPAEGGESKDDHK